MSFKNVVTKWQKSSRLNWKKRVDLAESIPHAAQWLLVVAQWCAYLVVCVLFFVFVFSVSFVPFHPFRGWHTLILSRLVIVFQWLPPTSSLLPLLSSFTIRLLFFYGDRQISPNLFAKKPTKRTLQQQNYNFNCTTMQIMLPLRKTLSWFCYFPPSIPVCAVSSQYRTRFAGLRKVCVCVCVLDL